MVHLPRRRSAAIVVAALLGMAGLSAPASAGTWPAAPTRVHVVAVSETALTVGAASAANATAYRLWTSRNRADLREPALSRPRAARHSATSRTPRVTVAGLVYRSGPLYYRFATVNGTHRRLSDLRTTYLRPPVPASVTVADPFGRPSLTWTDADVSGYQVRQSDDAAATSGVVTSTMLGHAEAFTPTYAATGGHPYFLSLRALNGTSRSAYSAPVAVTTTVGRSALSVLTNNDLNSNVTTDNGHPVPPWMTQRRDAAIALYRRVDPDILMIQEGGVLVSKGVRQVDTIADALGSTYTVAHTEFTPAEHAGYVSHGSYVIYRNTRLAAVGNGSTLTLSDGKYAAFQVLRDRTTQRAFLVVTTHLVAGGTGAADAQRKQEMTEVLAEAQRISGLNGGVPIILGGCLHEAHSAHHPADDPYTVLGGAGFSDALSSAQRRSGGDINTFNNYQRPIRSGVPTDRIFVGPGVAVTSWIQPLHRDGNNLAGVIPSDHNVVAAQVLLPGS